MIGIIGSNGMLGSAIRNRCELNGLDYKGYHRDIADFKDLENLGNILDETIHKVIINTAAVINIDECNKNPNYTEIINTKLPYFLSEYCKLRNIKFIQISTDHYYTNNSKTKHKEDDPVCILNDYSRQKFNAEYYVSKNSNSAIIRTSILGYNSKQNSLVQWILKEIKYKKEITGFVDAYTSSIDVDTLATIILNYNQKLTGIINISCKETYSKYELIKKIINVTGSKCKLIKGSVGSLSSTRANSTGLDCTLFMTNYNFDLPSFSEIIKSLNIKDEYNEI